MVLYHHEDFQLSSEQGNESTQGQTHRHFPNVPYACTGFGCWNQSRTSYDKRFLLVEGLVEVYQLITKSLEHVDNELLEDRQ